MKRNHLIAIIALVGVLGVITTIVYSEVDKTTVVSNDVQGDIREEENAIQKKIDEGVDKLKGKKYDEALKIFEEAISKEVTNKETYIKIKDIYIEISRLDDAYYIVKLAIANDVNTDEMNKMAEEIRSKFDIAHVIDTTSIYANYELPKQVEANINNEKVKSDVTWEDFKVTKVGEYTINGFINKYDRKVIMKLSVNSDITKEKAIEILKKKVGSENKEYNLYKEDTIYGERYLMFENITLTPDGGYGGDTLLCVNIKTGNYYIYTPDKKLYDENYNVYKYGPEYNMYFNNREKLDLRGTINGTTWKTKDGKLEYYFTLVNKVDDGVIEANYGHGGKQEYHYKMMFKEEKDISLNTTFKDIYETVRFEGQYIGEGKYQNTQELMYKVIAIDKTHKIMDIFNEVNGKYEYETTVYFSDKLVLSN